MHESIIHTQDAMRLRVVQHVVDQEKALVCFVHGLGEHVGRYAHVIEALNASGFSVALFDLRGHGMSDGKRGHAPDYSALMDDIALFIETVASTSTHVFLYGHSLGGNLAVNFALRRRPDVRGVIATSPAFEPAFKPPKWKLFFGKLAYIIAPSLALSNELSVCDISRDPEVVAAYLNDPLVHDRLSARLGMDILKTGQWALANAHRVIAPMLIMHGTDDKITSCAASEMFVSRAEGRADGKFWDALSHETHNEPEKSQVLTYVINWLDTQLEQPPLI
ncbi:MAG: lysophospholipase [Pseudomonadota bacterium]